MDAAQDGHPPGAEVGLQRLRRLQGAQAGRLSPGRAPPPTSPWVSTAVQGWRGERASARASARRRSSSGGAESMADTGTAVPSRQSSRVASRAARASSSLMSSGSLAYRPDSNRMALPSMSTRSISLWMARILSMRSGVMDRDTRETILSPSFRSKPGFFFRSSPMWETTPLNIPPEPVTGFCCLPRSATMPRIISPIFFSSPPQASAI